MDAESAKPRVNGSMLAKHMGQYVCLVGKNMAVSLCVKQIFVRVYVRTGKLAMKYEMCDISI